MTEPHPDLEELAALVDGRLSGAARDRALRRLAESSEAYEVLTETVRLREDAKVVRFPAWRRWPGVVVPLAAAAALALLLIQPVMQRLRPAVGVQLSGAELAAPLVARGDLAVRLGENWDQRAWSVTRGGPARLVEPAVAFRLGVRSADLAMALRLGDRERADRLAAQVVTLLGDVEMSQAVAARYADLRAQLAAGEASTGLTATAAGAEASLRELLGTPRFEFGQWVGAAELAARVQSAAFFRSEPTSGFFDTAERLDLDRVDLEALRLISELARGAITPSQYSEIQELLRAIIRRSAG